MMGEWQDGILGLRRVKAMKSCQQLASTSSKAALMDFSVE